MQSFSVSKSPFWFLIWAKPSLTASVTAITHPTLALLLLLLRSKGKAFLKSFSFDGWALANLRQLISCVLCTQVKQLFVFGLTTVSDYVPSSSPAFSYPGHRDGRLSIDLCKCHQGVTQSPEKDGSDKNSIHIHNHNRFTSSQSLAQAPKIFCWLPKRPECCQ